MGSKATSEKTEETDKQKGNERVNFHRVLEDCYCTRATNLGRPWRGVKGGYWLISTPCL
jgi:hypothetical protein